ncbi:MAG: NTP transferase domain-containing protein [Alphaproteobacteria bacterium]|jgi:molybdenum cofactor cytidylyltransferase
MKFGSILVAVAEGGILAHSVRAGRQMLKKGRVLTAEDIGALLSAGIAEITIARLEHGDVHEDEAAAAIAAQLGGKQVRVGRAFTGRANLHALADGLAAVAANRIEKLNSIDESITVATVAPFSRVHAGQMIATVKIIPFAAPRTAVMRAENLLCEPAIVLAPFRRRSAALILTEMESSSPASLDKTRATIAQRVKNIGSEIVFERTVAHTIEALSVALSEAATAADLILVFGASAITDRRDVIPAAIERSGGTLERFGMPVDPGNLLLLGRLGQADVVGLPGCARSPKVNGFDFVLWRLAADLPVTSADIARMGIGGLLKEIPARPQPREGATSSVARKIGAVVLAAGTSSRMADNKLLVPLNGKPLVRRAVEAVLESEASPVVVVTGKDAKAVRLALAGCAVAFADNPSFSYGLSTSLKLGLRQLPENCDGAVIVLGDMPATTPQLINRLIVAFDPDEDRVICVATHNGKRGNPVLLARRFFEEIESIEGDVGARGLIGTYPELVCEVEAGSDAPLIDIDTPEDLAAYLKAHQ